ncbi:O-antigen ligase family protein [Kovacikia minuta CCNUW1]|uniref:O-antigen ligase family protein n=1 Tax=Kovacikia minuta TaxID=2931930 RepID=UPI001CCE7C76|nr:O-antigen ligase family protein [Kovacikia minuta]UBF23585.1 O-antigen ligase family protein [Kovacikia minuta CCNUW1]
MWSEKYRNAFSQPVFWVGVVGIATGLMAGVLSGVKPIYLGLLFVLLALLLYFFTNFEQAVLGLLILRSSLDIFSAQQLPAVLAIGIDGLTLLYIAVQLFRKKPIHVDNFFWIFAAWVASQALWIVLLPIGGLGFDGSYLSVAIREWARLFSCLMIYLLVMQLKNRIAPTRVISLLFLGLVMPLTVATLQAILPASALPEILSAKTFGDASRISGTLGHSNTFATFLLLFVSLTCWKIKQGNNRLPWMLLLGVILFFYVRTMALFSLLMLAVFVVVLITPKANLLKVVAGLLLVGGTIALFASTEFGQARLGSLANTPLLNRDMDISRAILLSAGDNNSFNWRIAQWNYLLEQWQQFPIFGYGLGTSIHVSTNKLLPHNDYIRALVEEGIVGLIAFLAFLGIQVLYLVRLIRSAPHKTVQADFCLTLLAVLLALPIGMLTENIWSHTTFFFYWWTLFSVVSWDWNQLRIRSQESEARSQAAGVRYQVLEKG